MKNRAEIYYEPFCPDFLNVLLPSERGLLMGSSTEIDYAKKETIVKQKSFVSYIHFLINGLAKIYLEGYGGKHIIINIIKPGEFIDLNILYGPRNHYTTVVALKNCKVLAFETEAFRKVLSTNTLFALKVFEWYCNNAHFVHNKLTSFGTKQMHGRLSDVLLYLASPENEKHEVYAHISRKDIADMAGMSTESAIRLLTEFKNDRLINMNGKSIEINNMELLQRLSLIG
jgi:CRP-like cAMP-binding protein